MTALTLALAKQFLRYDASDTAQDDTLTLMLRAGQEWVEEYTGIPLVSGLARYARVYKRGLFSAFASSSSTRAVLRSPDMGSADHWVETVYRERPANTNNIVALRLTDSQNFLGYFTATNGLSITVVKRVTGTNTTLATFTLAIALQRGDRIKLGIMGSDMTLWVNGTALAPTTGSLTGLTGLPASSTRQGVVVGGNRGEICWRYATGLS